MISHFLQIPRARWTICVPCSAIVDEIVQGWNKVYRKTSNIRRTLVGNKIVYHSDVVGASPVGAAQTTSSFSPEHLALMDWA